MQDSPKILEEEELDFGSADIDLSPPKDVFVYNELRSCADLVRLADERTLNLQPDFQRNVVWNDKQQTEFIDSLVKQLPIPSMCFSLDSSTQERLVIDGLQRMTTINRFLRQKDWKLGASDGISKELAGKTVFEIEKEHPRIYKLVENTSLPVTIVRCDSQKPDHLEYLFMIFHRLNTGGVKLYNQEIRNCIYTGSFNNLLRELSQNEKWILEYRIKTKRIDRMKDEELVLRFFAFSESWETYDGALVKYLNEYMRKNRSLTEADEAAKRNLFLDTVELVAEKLPTELLDVSNTAKEAAFVGIARNLQFLKKVTALDFENIYNKFISDESIYDLKEGVMQRKKVLQRMQAATEIFSCL